MDALNTWRRNSEASPRAGGLTLLVAAEVRKLAEPRLRSSVSDFETMFASSSAGAVRNGQPQPVE